MIKHIVMWKLKDFSNGNDKNQNAQIIKERLEKLPEIIEEVSFLEVGIDISNTSSSYDVVLCSEFESEEKLKAYATHPEHLKVVEFITEVKEERIVVDYIV
ncbi:MULTISPECIES: Dabb family protein [Clostridium]|uniref:Dabb family protein n=1 Tax=Clostridium cadaveris TaxID=1529 RepID=A0A316M6T0_9CLOT|nr:Dabb family protein [Clostridium cadaveris]MDU4952551.1 Dabb family protein [Clostridium sp.]MDY4948783.1 Dabb family protein [Clostridium cadaveris]NME65509.1 Dabb family protein [Clostridium cadaveris]NWK11920.1 Dabb family protein [Clostridium cadaveris]PWL53691.1 MAG: Dabb family protein [Clostridium cadaveris]